MTTAYPTQQRFYLVTRPFNEGDTQVSKTVDRNLNASPTAYPNLDDAFRVCFGAWQRCTDRGLSILELTVQAVPGEVRDGCLPGPAYTHYIIETTTKPPISPPITLEYRARQEVARVIKRLSQLASRIKLYGVVSQNAREFEMVTPDPAT